MRIFVSIQGGELRDSFVDRRAEERLAALGAQFWEGSAHISPGELGERLKSTDVLMTCWGCPEITESMLDGSPLKLIVHTGGSVGSLVAPGVYAKGVRVASGNAYFAESVAEGVLGYMLFALRKMGAASNALHEGRWIEPVALRTEGLLDQTVGIVSLGAISRRLIEMGRVFRLRFKVFSQHPDQELAKALGFEYAGLEEIFSECKIVSLHTAARPETRHMIGAKLFALMRPDAIFINTARGSVVDEAALAKCLSEKRFRAVLDVYEKEPLSPGHPLIGLENAELFPHCGGPTYDRRSWITNRMLDNLDAFIKGEPMENEVDFGAYSRMTL
ncbi:MAG: hydroxyacid dehydrogenase [Clostridiales bacterium]|jgi:phosphoglycerate dehydrogenase-like enzyme|nr:hydroxyacid dehydrogenase [Clostridiales bacterium]